MSLRRNNILLRYSDYGLYKAELVPVATKFGKARGDSKITRAGGNLKIGWGRRKISK